MNAPRLLAHPAEAPGGLDGGGTVKMGELAESMANAFVNRAFRAFAAMQVNDRQIIGEVKSYKYTPKAQANTRFPRVMLDCWFLSLVKAEIKLLVLTDEKFYVEFKKDSDGLLPPSIKICHCPV